MADTDPAFDSETYVAGLEEERVRVDGEGDKDRVAAIDAELKKYRKAERAPKQPRKQTAAKSKGETR